MLLDLFKGSSARRRYSDACRLESFMLLNKATHSSGYVYDTELLI